MRRTVGIVALALLAVLPTGADAAPSPQLTDPAGDTPVASADILRADLTVVGRPGREFLQIAITYAGSLVGAPPYTRGLTFTVGGCKFGAVQFSHATGPIPEYDVGCATGASAGKNGTMQVAGPTLFFRTRLDGLDLRRGAQITKLAAFTHPGGFFALHTPLTTAGDVAEGRSWVIGS